MPPAQETQGRTEQYIGSWLKGRKRESVVLATKVRCAVPCCAGQLSGGATQRGPGDAVPVRCRVRPGAVQCPHPCPRHTSAERCSPWCPPRTGQRLRAAELAARRRQVSPRRCGCARSGRWSPSMPHGRQSCAAAAGLVGRELTRLLAWLLSMQLPWLGPVQRTFRRR